MQLPLIPDMLVPVILESPYAGDIERNVIYARRAMRHSMTLGEAPMVSHLLYTQVLDDNKPAERRYGIEAGLTWRRVARYTVVYTDYGISSGMKYGIDLMLSQEGGVFYRTIGLNP